MGRQHAKIISKAAFEKAFVEGEVIMRRNLAALIEKEIQLAREEYRRSLGQLEPYVDSESFDHYINGLRKAQEIVFGKVERDES